MGCQILMQDHAVCPNPAVFQERVQLNLLFLLQLLQPVEKRGTLRLFLRASLHFKGVALFCFLWEQNPG